MWTVLFSWGTLIHVRLKLSSNSTACIWPLFTLLKKYIGLFCRYKIVVLDDLTFPQHFWLTRYPCILTLYYDVLWYYGLKLSAAVYSIARVNRYAMHLVPINIHSYKTTNTGCYVITILYYFISWQPGPVVKVAMHGDHPSSLICMQSHFSHLHVYSVILRFDIIDYTLSMHIHLHYQFHVVASHQLHQLS